MRKKTQKMPQDVANFRQAVMVKLASIRTDIAKDGLITASEKRMKQHGDPQTGREEHRVLLRGLNGGDVAKYGSNYGKAVALFNDTDPGSPTRGTLGDDFLTINKSISPGDRYLVDGYLKAANYFKQYGEKLMFVYKMYQIDAAVLKFILDEKDQYEAEAQVMTTIIKETAGTEGKACVRKAVSKMIAEKSNERVTFCMDDTTGKVTAKVKINGPLYSNIKYAAREAKKKMGYVRAYVNAFDDVLSYYDLYALVPQSVSSAMLAIKGEWYLMTAAPNKAYRQSEITERQERGEIITPRERRWALFPDFYNVKPNARMRIACKGMLQSGIPLWPDENGNLPPEGDDGFKSFCVRGQDESPMGDIGELVTIHNGLCKDLDYGDQDTGGAD